MGTSDVVTTSKSGEIDVKDTAAMGSVPYYRPYIKNNHRKPQSLQIEDSRDFVCLRNTNFNYWRSRQNGYTSSPSGKCDRYRQQAKRQGRSSQQSKQNPLQTSNQPESTYWEGEFEAVFVRSWYEGTWTGPLPTKVTSSKYYLKRIQRRDPRCKAPPHQNGENENHRFREVHRSKYGATRG